MREQQDSARRHAGYRGNVVEFHRDITADKRYRKNGVRTFHKPAGASVRNHSVWWGVDGVRLVDARIVPAADLALGRLEPFDPQSVTHYPWWKDPSRGATPGRSLCKLGYPLHRIVPVYDEKANTFTLPEGSVPLPLFPMEGMFTRVVNTRAPGSGDGEMMTVVCGSLYVFGGRIESTWRAGWDAARRVGDLIEHATAATGCAFAHDVKAALGGSGNVDHVVMTPAGLWVKDAARGIPAGPRTSSDGFRAADAGAGAARAPGLAGRIPPRARLRPARAP